MKDHRNNYATDTTLESDVGYEAKVGDPVVEAEMTVDGDSIVFPCNGMHAGNYLVTLEINGVPILYRESVKFEEAEEVEATVDGIKIHYGNGGVEVTYDVSDGDVVRLTIEPLEVKVTDGFRAAVKKACKCDSSSGGGSPLIVHCTVSNDEYVLSEDWDTINEAFTEDGRPVLIELLNPGTKSSSTCTYCLVTEVRSIENASEAKSDSGTGYVVVCTNLSNVDFNLKYIFYSDTSSGTLSCSEALTIGGGGGGGSTGGGVLVVHGTITENADESWDYTVDKTWQEIHDADTVVLKFELHNDGMDIFILNDLIATFIQDNESYGVMFSSPDADFKFCSSMLTTNSANGYPSHHEWPHY